MLPMIVNSPAAPLLLMFLFLLLAVFLFWQIYRKRHLQPILQTLEAIRDDLNQLREHPTDTDILAQLDVLAARQPNLQRAWQAYRSQLLPDQQGHLRGQYPAAHWFGQENFATNLPPLGLMTFLLPLFGTLCALAWWLFSAGVSLSDWHGMLGALQSRNAGALGLVFAGFLAMGWLARRRTQAGDSIEQQIKMLAQELDACFPLGALASRLEHSLNQQMSQWLGHNLFNTCVLANALQASAPAADESPLQAHLDNLSRLLEQQQQHLQTQLAEMQTMMQTDFQQRDAQQNTFNANLKQAASALHDFVEMLGYLNKIVPEYLHKSGEALQHQVFEAGQAWQAQLSQPLESLQHEGQQFAHTLHQAGETLSTRLDDIAQSLDTMQQKLQHTTEQLQYQQPPLDQAVERFTQMLPHLHEHSSMAHDSIQQIENIALALQKTVDQQTQALDRCVEQQQLLNQQFDKHQKYTDGLTERLINTSKTLNYVASELQERTNIVQHAVIESAEIVTRLENCLRNKV